MDTEKEFIPIWEESPEVYYDPVILEIELDKVKKEFDELKYKSSELDKEYEVLKEELITKEKENVELLNSFKNNKLKLPFYQNKVLELSKIIKELNIDKKKLLKSVSFSNEKLEEIDKNYRDAMERYTTLMNTNKQLEKINAKYKMEKIQELKDKDRIKAENDKTRTMANEIDIQNKGFKAQLNHHADELRSKEIITTGLARENKILASNVENALMKSANFEKQVAFLEKKIKTMNKDCLESITKRSSLLHENSYLKAKLNDSEELVSTVEKMKANERALYKQMNVFKKIIAAEKVENKKLLEIANQLEKQKTKYIFTGEDITLIKRKLEECMSQNLNLTTKFSNLDCPFYQSKYGKVEDKEPKIKCGSLSERHYENKIFALEQVIKTLHLKIKSQEEKHLKYRDVVIKSIYNTKAAEKKVKSANILLEEQKYKIIYDKLHVLSKESKIQKLQIQNENFDYQCKTLNRQSTLLCKRIKDYNFKIESMKKDSLRANQIFLEAEQKNDELQHKTEQLEKCTENIEEQLQLNNKCKKRQQSEVDKLKSSIEKLQKKIHKTQEELNNTKQKNDELTNTITQFRNQNEFQCKVQSKCTKDAKNQMGKLITQNKKLAFENKCLSKLKEENKLLKFKLMTEERRLVYAQHKFNKLFNEKEERINAMRIPEIVVPGLKDSRHINDMLTRKLIQNNCEIKQLKQMTDQPKCTKNIS